MTGRGLYIHIPFCRHKCLYCDFASQAGREDDIAAYVDAVTAEMALAAAQYGPLTFSTVYLGGGTPSLLPPELLARLLEAASRRFVLSAGAEISMEANPGTVDERSLAGYRNAGVNRLSMGLQAVQEPLLRTLGRIHTAEDFYTAVEGARRAGFDNISVDLMSGLPGQRADDLLRSVEAAAPLCEHVSLYTLKVESGTPLEERIREGRLCLPDPDAEADMTAAAIARLRQLGFGRYEIANFARPGRACRHNINYWENGEYLGVGCAAASHLAHRRFRNAADLDGYRAAIAAGRPLLAEDIAQTPDDEAYDTIMLALRTAPGLNLIAFARRFGWDLGKRRAAAVMRILAGGLAERAGGRLWLTDRGMELQNAVLGLLLYD